MNDKFGSKVKEATRRMVLTNLQEELYKICENTSEYTYWCGIVRDALWDNTTLDDELKNTLSVGIVSLINLITSYDLSLDSLIKDGVKILKEYK